MFINSNYYPNPCKKIYKGCVVLDRKGGCYKYIWLSDMLKEKYGGAELPSPHSVKGEINNTFVLSRF